MVSAVVQRSVAGDPPISSESPPLMIEADGLCASYASGRVALRDFSCAIPSGARVALLGANGSGKTTCLLVLAGALAPTAGSLSLDGVRCTRDASALRAWRQRVGLVLADPDDQLIAPTVADDVAFGPRNMGMDDVTVAERVGAAVEALGIDALLPRAVHQLSLGERKRVALAGVLALRPAVLLLDEPTTGLDRRAREGLHALLAARHQAGATILVATHDTDFAWDWADGAIVLEGGQVLAEGTARQILSDQALLDRAWLDRPANADANYVITPSAPQCNQHDRTDA
jgi:cobalt/nickel transport system ATP-binding protein